MRQQPARVVLGACLVAASIAAQAPLSPHNTTTADAAEGRKALTPDGSALSDRLRLSVPQDEDYSLTTLFQQAHGAFMSTYRRYEPNIKLTGSIMPDQHVADEPGSFLMFGGAADVNLPFVVSTDAYLTIGAHGSARRYMFSSTSGLDDETLYSIGPKVGFGWFLSDDVLWEMETHPGAWSDLEGTMKHWDFDFPSSTLFTFRGTESFYWKLGVRYNQTFEDAPWLPLIGMSWDLTGTVLPPGETSDVGTWRIDALLPEFVEISYWMTPSTGLSLGTQIQGAEYSVHTNVGSVRQRDNLRVQEVQAYLGLTHRFSDMFSFQVQAGANVAGQYDLTSGQTGFTHVDGALGTGFFANVSFGFDW